MRAITFEETKDFYNWCLHGFGIRAIDLNDTDLQLMLATWEEEQLRMGILQDKITKIARRQYFAGRMPKKCVRQ